MTNDSMDRLPPHSPDAERAVLGCLLYDAADPERSEAQRREAIDEVLRRRITGAHFYDLRHQAIFATILELGEKGTPVDVLFLSQALRDRGKLEAVGGLTYLNDLVGCVSSPGNLGHYLDVVADKHALRNVLRLCTETIAQAFGDPGDDVKAFVAQFEAGAMALSEEHVPTEFIPLPTCVPAYIDAIEARHRGRQAITGLATPFWYLNNITCGLQPHEFVVMGSRPSCGKTAIALDFMRAAISGGVGVLFFSIEMARQEIMGRIVAAEARVDGLKLRNGFWTHAKEASIVEAAKRVGSWDRFFIDDRSMVTGQDVFVAARRAKRQHSIGLVVVDYLQLMQSTRRYNSRVEEVAEVSHWLKRTAKELGIPVMACAQLGRDSEKERAGRPPLMADLRECGNIEQDADVIALLYEPKLDDDDYDDMRWLAHHQPDDPKEDGDWNTLPGVTLSKMGQSVEVRPGWREEFRRINLVIVKNRNGQTGPCELVYQRRSTRFVDAHSPRRVKESKGQLL